VAAHAAGRHPARSHLQTRRVHATGALTHPPDDNPTSQGLTCVVVAYNSAQPLQTLLTDLANAGLPPASVIVVDNASRDNSAAIAESHGAQIVRSEQNIGFGRACNLALPRVRTPLVCIVNPDVRVGPETLPPLIRLLTTDPSVAICGPIWDRDNPTVRRASSAITDIVGALPQKLFRRVESWSRDRPIATVEPDAIEVPFVVGALMVARTDALLAVGGFDDRFFLYYEEEDLCVALRARGWRAVIVRSAVAFHAGTGSSDGIDPAGLAPVRMRSEYLFFRKHRSRLYAELARASGALMVLATSLWRRARGREPAQVAGTIRAMYGLERRQR
jgi:N-acetylglucosaminyl-diphospho-decaprenol L-rhamnosyltransferase